MRRFGISILAAAFVASAAATASACDKSKSGEGCGKTVTLAAARPGCPKAAASSNDVVEKGVARVMASMPQITYRVGDTETTCAHTARAKAADSDTPVVYVVAGESFTSRARAMDKLAELMLAEIPKITQVAHVVGDEVTHCPKAAAELAAEKNCAVKHVLAGVQFECSEKAQAVAERLAEKMKELGVLAKSSSAGEGGTGAKVASFKSGCCSKKGAGAKVASGKRGHCGKGQTDAKLAAGKAGCRGKKDAGDKAASGKRGHCGKGQTDAKLAAGKAGCRGKKDAGAKLAASESGCDKSRSGCGKKQVVTAKADKQKGDTEDTPELTAAKQMVRRIVEFVANAQSS